MAQPDNGQDGLPGIPNLPPGRPDPPRPPVSNTPAGAPFEEIEGSSLPKVDVEKATSDSRKKSSRRSASDARLRRTPPRRPFEAEPSKQVAANDARIEAETTDPLAHEDVAEVAIQAAPAWLVSLLFHTTMIILLALLYVAREMPDIISLDLTYAETLGDQLEDDTLQSAASDALEIVEPAYAIDQDPVDDPLAAPPETIPDSTGLLASESMNAPSIGVALTGREKGMKKALLAKYGGTGRTEAAVTRALEWLKRNQLRGGAWSLIGPYDGRGFRENRTAATAMALLAFQGAGNTHDAGPFKEQVERGWRVLLKDQTSSGSFVSESLGDATLYSQAQAMIAICEIYGMTKDSRFRAPAQRAIDYAVKIQADEGGWRYRPGFDSDTSVTGWFVMGLQSGLMAGLEVPSPTLQRVSEFLDDMAAYGGAYYKYHAARVEPSVSMTAEGLLCRQYLGWKRSDERLQEGVDFLLDHPIEWEDQDVYYWYYATQVAHHMEGEAWDRWNLVMREVIPENQVREGKEAGSWSPVADRWGHQGGRLYVTCLAAYMLEVYYRHLPIYAYRIE